MPKPVATALLLLLLAAGVGAAVLAFRPKTGGRAWDNRVDNPQSMVRQSLLSKLDINLAEVRSVRLSGPHPLTLERQGESWQLPAPLHLAVPPDHAETLLTPLANLWIDRGETAANPPAAEDGAALEITLADGRTCRFTPGSKLGAGLAQVSVAGETYVVNEALHLLLADPPSALALATKRLPLPPPSQIDRITLSLLQRQQTLVRDDHGTFVFDPPARAGQTGIGQLLTQLTQIDVEDFSDDVPPFTPEASLTLHSGADHLTLEVGPTTLANAADGSIKPLRLLHLLRPGLPALAARVDGRFTIPDLRDPRLLLPPLQSLTALTLSAPGVTPLTLRRSAEQWQIDGQEKTALDTARCAAAWQAAFAVQAADYGPPPATPAIATATFHFNRTQETLSLHPGPKPDTLWAMRSGDAEARQVPAAPFQSWLGGTRNLQEHAVHWLPAGTQLASIRVQQPWLGIEHTFAPDASSGWKRPDGAAFDQASLSQLIHALTELEAADYLPPAAPSTTTPALVAALTLTDARGQGHRLDLLADGTFTCSGYEAPGRMQATPTLVRALQAEFRPHRLLAIPPEKIRKIHLETPEQRITLERGADGALPTKPNLAPTAIAAFFESAGHWIADRAEAMPAGQPDTTLTVTETDGTEHRLALHGSTAVVGDRAFVLPPSLRNAIEELWK